MDRLALVVAAEAEEQQVVALPEMVAMAAHQWFCSFM
jgi:hypothetical protein